MNTQRRNFLRFAPAALAFGAAPIVTTVAAAAIPAESSPMRGKTRSGADWAMTIFETKGPDLPDARFISSHMEQRADGKYEMVYDREAA